MSDRHLTDARISIALRDHIPVDVPPGLAGRIAEGVATTRQQPPRPFARWLDPVHPRDRSRLLWLAAALLLATAVGVGLVAGAWQLLHQEGPLPPAEVTTPLDLSTPQAIRAFVHSAYDQMPALPPMTISTMQDGAPGATIRVGTNGRVRIDEPVLGPSSDTDPYRIYSGTTFAQLAMVGSEPVWVRQDDGISEDPRVFVLAALQGSAWGAEPGCSSASPDETEASAAPGTSLDPGWALVGREQRLGRDTYHLACGEGDVWIDAQTRLVLRSEGPRIDADYQPIPGSRTVLEVTALELGVPDGGWFDLHGPTGARTMTAEEYQCAAQPESCATPEPVPSEERVVDRGTVPPVTPTGASNGWIAYSTDPAVVITQPPSESGPVGPATSGSDLYLVRVGGEPIKVADRAGATTWNACPAFSPDGGRLAFGVASGSERAMVVRTMGPDGVIGDAIRIAAPTSEAIPCPRWSADGRRLGYLDGPTVRMFGLDGSAVAAAAGDPGVTDFVTRRADDDPSQVRIASPSGDRTARLDYAGDCQLVLETPDGANVEVVLFGAGLGARRVEPSIGCPYAIAGWAPDGRSILLMQDISGRDFAMHAVDVEAPYTLTTVVASVRTNSGRSWSGYGDVSWQPVRP